MWDVLRKDEQLVSMMNEVRKTSSKQPLIYTFEIPESYQKTEEAPFMRLTEIMNGNALENMVAVVIIVIYLPLKPLVNQSTMFIQ